MAFLDGRPLFANSTSKHNAEMDGDGILDGGLAGVNNIWPTHDMDDDNDGMPDWYEYSVGYDWTQMVSDRQHPFIHNERYAILIGGSAMVVKPGVGIIPTLECWNDVKKLYATSTTTYNYKSANIFVMYFEDKSSEVTNYITPSPANLLSLITQLSQKSTVNDFVLFAASSHGDQYKFVVQWDNPQQSLLVETFSVGYGDVRSDVNMEGLKRIDRLSYTCGSFSIFLNKFTDTLKNIVSIKDAFIAAKAYANSIHSEQVAQLDDNGDGYSEQNTDPAMKTASEGVYVPTISPDGELSAHTYL